jgi:hypothetical protein
MESSYCFPGSARALHALLRQVLAAQRHDHPVARQGALLVRGF